jgi:hypothetical protein
MFAEMLRKDVQPVNEQDRKKETFALFSVVELAASGAPCPTA